MSFLSRIFGGRRSCNQQRTQQQSCQSGQCGSRRTRSRSQCRTGRCAQTQQQQRASSRDSYARGNCRTGNCPPTSQDCRTGNCPPAPTAQRGVQTRRSSCGCGCGGSCSGSCGCGGNCKCKHPQQPKQTQQARPQAQDPCADGNCKTSVCEDGRCVTKECVDGKCTTTVCEDGQCTTTRCDEKGNCAVTTCKDGVCETASCSGPGCDPIVLHNSARVLSRYNLIDGKPAALLGKQAKAQREALGNLLGVPAAQVKDQWIQEAWASVTGANGARKANAGELLRQYVECRTGALDSDGSCAIGAAAIAPKQEAGAVDQAKAGLWLNNVEEAKKAAAELDRPVIAFFTGKGWCGPCAQFESNVLSKPEFREWAKENAVLLQLPYPSQTGAVPQQTADMARQFKIKTVPTTVFMGSDGVELGRLGNQSGTTVTEWLKSAKKELQAKQRAYRTVGAGAGASYLAPEHIGWA